MQNTLFFSFFGFSGFSLALGFHNSSVFLSCRVLNSEYLTKGTINEGGTLTIFLVGATFGWDLGWDEALRLGGAQSQTPPPVSAGS